MANKQSKQAKKDKVELAKAKAEEARKKQERRALMKKIGVALIAVILVLGLCIPSAAFMFLH